MNQKSAPVARLYGLCSSADHHTDLCPFVQQSEAIEQPEAYAANIYNRPPQPQQQNQPQKNNYDLSRNRYNPGWRNHPNLRWSNHSQQQQQQQQQQQPQKQQIVEASPQPSLEELVRQMTMQNMQFQQETRASIQSLTNQMGQLATQLNQQQPQNSDRLPSQSV